MVAEWSEATWELNEETLAGFLRISGFRGRNSVDEKLARAFTCCLSFSNCEGHEKRVFALPSSQAKAPSTVSFAWISLRLSGPRGGVLVTDLSAEWHGIMLHHGIDVGWLSGAKVPKHIAGEVHAAVAGVRENWRDIATVSLIEEICSPDFDGAPTYVGSSRLSCRVLGR